MLSPSKAATTTTKTMENDCKSIMTENVIDSAMTKCSTDMLENPISINSVINRNAQELSQSPASASMKEKSISKGNNLMKKTLVVEKLKSTNSVITRKIFSTRRVAQNSNHSDEKNKETLKINDSSDLDVQTITTKTDTATTLKNNIVKEDSHSMITSLLRTTTL